MVTQLLLGMSGWFVSLPWFLSQHYKNLEWQTTRFKTIQKLQFSSVQFKQIDLFLDRHSQDMGAGWPQISCPPPNPSWLSPFYTFHLLFFGCALCTTGLVLTTSQEKGCTWAYAQGQLTTASYITGSVCMSSHDSVCYNQIYICVEYLWTFNVCKSGSNS